MPGRTITGFRLDDGQIEVVDPMMAAILREKSPAEKIAMVSSSHRLAKLLVTAGARQRHPDWSEEQIAVEVRRRMLGGTV